MILFVKKVGGSIDEMAIKWELIWDHELREHAGGHSHMTSKVHLKDLLTGKLPYYWYTTAIYTCSERRANKWKSDLGCVSGREKDSSMCFLVQIQRQQSIAHCLSDWNTVVQSC